MNVIDQKGGLDATGQVVDGNHAAGVAKPALRLVQTQRGFWAALAAF